MASKKKAAPEWLEGDECALHRKISKVIGEDGQERIAVLLDGFAIPVTVDHWHVVRL